MIIRVHKGGVADLMVRRGGNEVSTAVVAASWPRILGKQFSRRHTNLWSISYMRALKYGYTRQAKIWIWRGSV